MRQCTWTSPRWHARAGCIDRSSTTSSGQTSARKVRTRGGPSSTRASDRQPAPMPLQLQQLPLSLHLSQQQPLCVTAGLRAAFFAAGTQHRPQARRAGVTEHHPATRLSPTPPTRLLAAASPAPRMPPSQADLARPRPQRPFTAPQTRCVRVRTCSPSCCHSCSSRPYVLRPQARSARRAENTSPRVLLRRATASPRSRRSEAALRPSSRERAALGAASHASPVSSRPAGQRVRSSGTRCISLHACWQASVLRAAKVPAPGHSWLTAQWACVQGCPP